MREQFASWVKSIAVAYKRKGSKQARRPFQEGGERARLEALEVRQLLSVTVQELAGPLEDAGSTWTYDDDPNDPSGSTDVQTNTSEGLNGSKLRMDINVASFDAGSNTRSSVSGIATYGFISSGLVLYDQAAAGAVGTDGTIDFSPFELILPSVMDVGPHFYVNDSTQTVIDDQGKVKDTQVHIEIQLLTPTPSVTVMAMGQPFQCYEVETTETDTPAGMSANSPISTVAYFSPSVGEVAEADASDPTNYTSILTGFHDSTTLDFLQQPTDNAVNGDIPVKVEIRTNGALSTKSTKSISLSLIPSDGNSTGILEGRVTTPAADGVATFDGISVNNNGTYTLQATDGVHTVNSQPFKILDGKLVFLVQPKSGNIDQPLSPVVRVALEDGKGEILSDVNGDQVTLAFQFSGPGSVNASGNTATFADGVATFPALSVDTPENYTLGATDLRGDAQGTSNPFVVKGNHLVFTAKPADTGVGQGVAFTVTLEDANNKVVTTHNGDLISVGLDPVGNSAASNVVSIGTGAPVPLVNGVATFTATNGFAVRSVGTYTLTAEEDDDLHFKIQSTDTATSGPINIKGNHLVFKVKPASTVGVKTPIPMQVQLLDFKNRVVTSDSTDQVVLQINPLNGSPATVSDATVTLENGVADLSGDTALSIGSVGTYSYTAVLEDSSNAPIGSTPGITSGKITVKPNMLIFHTQPKGFNHLVGTATFSVWLVNYQNKLISTEETNSVALTLVEVTGKSTDTISTSNFQITNGNVQVISDPFPSAGTYYYTATEIGTDDSPIDTTLTAMSSKFKVT